MQVEKIPGGGARITLGADELRYFRLALERAMFQDTPPQHQRAIYALCDELLKKLETT